MISAIIYLMFFLSGASALVYEVTWVRSLSLIFGGSHLAVTTVLSVFMGGLALGGYVIGRRIDSMQKLLMAYGYLEIGIAAFAGLFIGLIRIYPDLYTLLARGADENPLYLTFLRILFTVIAMIVPTTLMGGTLPVLTRFVSDRRKSVGTQLSFLYGFNTLGAVTGTLAAGFFLLWYFGVNATLAIAISVNLIIGAAAVALQGRVDLPFTGEKESKPPWEDTLRDDGPRIAPVESGNRPAYRMVLWGIGISGFCALGYEVLWTRILSMVVGTSVYGFSIMLTAFLSGIALGSQFYGVVQKVFRTRERGKKRSVAVFGILQILIGIAALAVTYSLRELPAHAIGIQNLFLKTGISEFHVRLGANFLVAFAYMFFPAFFMGLSFPLAGEIHAGDRNSVGGAVGEVVTFNTVGAILGAAVSGFVLLYLFGIERSLQFLTLINICAGLWITAVVMEHKLVRWLALALAMSAIPVLGLNPGWARVWNAKYFAIFRNNQRDAFSTPEKIRDALENTDVLFYHEGANETISVIQPKGSDRALLVNGKVVASSMNQDRQCQYTLGHLPMLFHRNPRKVWVLGMGTGMTLGATSIHPEVEEVTLVELERRVIDVAGMFGPWNHEVVENPKLQIVINDGRNFLMTTGNRYDVITADPIHPWTQGAAYLYTTEYYRLAAERLQPGGIMCQWVPIYELSVSDLKSIVRTFGENFRFMMLWLTHYDAELIGSNEPIVINEGELRRRIAEPAIAKDLRSVEMGTAEDFLSYFVMGTEGLRAFSREGTVNTDDNLHLEFSAPRSVGVGSAMGRNVLGLAKYRESIVPYLSPGTEGKERADQVVRWGRLLEPAKIYDWAHTLFLEGRYETKEFTGLLAGLERRFPDYAPGIFLKNEYLSRMASTPRLLQIASFDLLADAGERKILEISAVTMRVGKERAVVMFVDNRARKIYGQLYMDGRSGDLDELVRKFADDVMGSLKTGYLKEAERAQIAGRAYPVASATQTILRNIVSSKVEEYALSGQADGK